VAYKWFSEWSCDCHSLGLIMAFYVVGGTTLIPLGKISRYPKLLTDGRDTEGGGSEESGRPTEGKMFPRGK
jgi:hypothetical protein